MKLVIISGRSGSGKSTALHMLEDAGFFCVDNLPAGILPELVRQALQSTEPSTDRARQQADFFPSHGKPVQNIAVGIDARNIPSDLSRFGELIKDIPKAVNTSILYLDANDATLIKRFSETRRKHPLTDQHHSLTEAIIDEAKMLEPISSLADLIIDTSHMTLHQLRELIKDRVGSNLDEHSFSLLFQSFGFKQNVPIDSDYVFDVRCLPNPYWVKELRQQTGLDKSVQDFLSSDAHVDKLIADLKLFLDHWLPEYSRSNRSYMTISIGCTGGKHRSVYVAAKLFEYFKKQYDNVQIRHRDIHSH